MIVGGNGCNPLRHYPWLGRGRLRSANDGQSPSSPLEVRDSAQELQCFQTTKHLHKDVQWNVPRIFFFHTNDKLPSPWLQLLLGTILTLPVLEQSYPEFCAASYPDTLKTTSFWPLASGIPHRLQLFSVGPFRSQAYLFYNESCSNK